MATSLTFGQITHDCKTAFDGLLGSTDIGLMRKRLAILDTNIRNSRALGEQSVQELRWMMAVMNAETVRVERARVQNGRERKARKLGQIEADWKRAKQQLCAAGTKGQVDDYFENCYEPSRQTINHWKRLQWLQQLRQRAFAKRKPQTDVALV